MWRLSNLSTETNSVHKAPNFRTFGGPFQVTLKTTGSGMDTKSEQSLSVVTGIAKRIGFISCVPPIGKGVKFDRLGPATAILF